MADHIERGIDGDGLARTCGYWIDPYPTVRRDDPSIAGLLAAIRRVPEEAVARIRARREAERRAALGW